MATKNKSQQTIDELCEKLKDADHEAQGGLLVKITNEVEGKFIREENNNSDSTDGAFNALSDIAQSAQEDFDELIDVGSDKEKFIKALPQTFALLLNTNVNSVEKIKRIIKIAIETTLKLWQGPRL